MSIADLCEKDMYDCDDDEKSELRGVGVKRQVDLQSAKQILKDYCEPDSLIDNGNLYFAACEYQEAYNQLQVQCDKLAESLDCLQKEVSGLMHAHRVVLRNDYGNSNCEAVQYRVDKAKETLKEYRKFCNAEE
jgi:hypothetical protein